MWEERYSPLQNKIHKMRAICLLEGNFNYYNKTIFACQMLASTQEKDQIPIERFAKKGSNCINAVMTKVIFCNEPAPTTIPRASAETTSAIATTESPTPQQV
jgi:hypothetical protein